MTAQKLIYVGPEENYDIRPEYIFVGEAPGAEEELQGSPFRGKSGQFLREALEKFINLSSRQYYITNAIKVRPEGNRTPTKAEIVSWCNALADEIENVDPSIEAKFIAVGKVAEQALDLIGIKSHFIYHPAHIMVYKAKYPEWVRQIKEIVSDD